MFTSYQAAVTLLLLLRLVMSVRGVGVLDVRVLEWESDGKLANGTCCNAACSCSSQLIMCQTLHRQSPFVPDCNIALLRSPVFAGNSLDAPFIHLFDIPGRMPPMVDVSLSVAHLPNVGVSLPILNITTKLLNWNSRSQPVVLTQNTSSASLKVELRFRCARHYYGEKCDRLCLPRNRRDPLHSHYSCNQTDGSMVCDHGWQGDMCSAPVCDGGCGHGQCTAPGQCQCERGWRGPNCGECEPLPGCQHGYCTRPGDCICHPHFTGTLCEKNNDVCSSVWPCENGGVCSSLGRPDHYRCECVDGWTGRNCTARVITACPEGVNYCLGGGRCMAAAGAKPACLCTPGRYGQRCELVIATDSSSIAVVGVGVALAAAGAVIGALAYARRNKDEKEMDGGKAEKMELNVDGGPPGYEESVGVASCVYSCVPSREELPPKVLFTV